MCVFLGSAAVVKDLDPGVRFVFCDFACRCLEVCGSCGFEGMLHFAWTLPAFANGSDLRDFLFLCFALLQMIGFGVDGASESLLLCSWVAAFFAGGFRSS